MYKLYLLLIKKALARRQLRRKKGNTAATFSFPGFKETASQRIPNEAPWREGVSTGWFGEQDVYTEDMLSSAPEGLTALHAQIPADFFTKDDDEWVADDEMDADASDDETEK